ncbi:metallophosphoesterase family protein [Peribacillus sp. B-H-3]|uniref:metallophosphoesterase family protein n=1 Tax=Peribacillus sp. B-H-3 TaxID=3400420 RepID=UPI003B017013
MKIIVLSDTHMPKKAKKLPSILLKELNNADLILHAGDWQTMEVYEELCRYGKVEGVYGNIDSQEILEIFPEKLILTVKQFKIGLIHGHGKKWTTEKRALFAFQDEDVDMIIYGHSHIPKIAHENKCLLFNPGSPTDKRRQKQYSFGIVTAGDMLEAKHIFFDEKD